MIVSNLGNLRNGRDVVLRISDTFDVDSLRILVNGCSERLRRIACHERNTDSELLQ